MSCAKNTIAAGLLFVALLFTYACDRDGKSAVKGQANATVTFYGKAVDEDGKPISGVHFKYRIEAYPKDWTFDTRGRPKDVLEVDAASGDDGRFRLDVIGSNINLAKAQHDGYRHLFDEDLHDSAINNRFYTLISWSDLCYKIDVEHPAVYTFVKDGVHEVSVLPCRGGYNSGNGKHWTENKPGWPKQPSLKDVVQREAATKP